MDENNPKCKTCPDRQFCPQGMTDDDWMKSGRPAVFTLGEIMSDLIDGSHNSLVIASVVGGFDHKSPPKFMLEIVPVARIDQRCNEIGCHSWTKRATAFREVAEERVMVESLFGRRN